MINRINNWIAIVVPDPATAKRIDRDVDNAGVFNSLQWLGILHHHIFFQQKNAMFVEHIDTEIIRGMIKKVEHLISVEVIEKESK